MSMPDRYEEILAKDDWIMECGSPLEIRHKDGDFASGYAARIVIAALEEEQKDEESIRIIGSMNADELERIVKLFHKKLPRRVIIVNHAEE